MPYADAHIPTLALGGRLPTHHDRRRRPRRLDTLHLALRHARAARAVTPPRSLALTPSPAKSLPLDPGSFPPLPAPTPLIHSNGHLVPAQYHTDLRMCTPCSRYHSYLPLTYLARVSPVFVGR